MLVRKTITDDLLIYVRKNYILEVDKYSEDQPRDEQGRWTSGGGSGGSAAHDSGNGNIAITDEAVENVPNVSIFDDEKKNERYRQANKDLLKEAQKHPVGTEVSRVYDADMKPIEGHGYKVGEKPGQVKIDDPGVPYHAFHNHPSGETFSPEDLMQFTEHDKQLSLTAIGNSSRIYHISKSPDANVYAYYDYLSGRVNEQIFFDGKFTYLDVKEFDIENLPNKLKNPLKEELISFSRNCIEEGKKYGFNYFES